MLSRSALKRTSMSSHRSSGPARRPCRTGGGVIFAGSSGGAGEEAVQLEKKLVELEKKLVEHRQISRASPFVMSLTSPASRFDSFVCDGARCISANHPSMGTHVKVVIPWVIPSSNESCLLSNVFESFLMLLEYQLCLNLFN